MPPPRKSEEVFVDPSKSCLRTLITEVNECMEQSVSLAARRIANDQLVPFLLYALKVKKDYDRALMIRLGCEANNGNWQDAIPAMTCSELLDFSICVVDDMLDLSASRLGKPAFYKKWNDRYALNVALILKCLANEVLLKKDFLNTVGRDNLFKIVYLFEKSHREVYEGQFLDIRLEELSFERVTPEMYLRMIGFTSGSQGAAYCQIGGIISGTDQEKIEALGEYGMCMGTIFQIRDDFIDYIDDEKEIGKPPFRDFLQKKTRLPMILGWRSFDRSEKRILLRLMDKSSLNKLEKRQIVSMILKDKVVEETNRIVQKLEKKAIKSLEVFPGNSKGKKALMELVALGASL